MTTFYLVRHGNIELADRIPGRAPGNHLSDHGRMQAENIALKLHDIPIDIVVTSPLERTIETVSPLLRNRHLVSEQSNDLIEIDFGDWTGRSFDELEVVQDWKLFHTFRSGIKIPGGELMLHVQARMVRALKQYHERFVNGTVVFVSHNDPIKSLIAYSLGISLDLFLRLTIDTGSISVLTFDGSMCVVKMINKT